MSGYESSDRQVDDLKPPPWRCAVHHLQVPDGDCPKCDAELIALTEQDAQDDLGVRVELDRLSRPATCRIWHDGVLVFDGVDRSALASRATETGPVDWDSPTWGGGRHEAAWAPDGTHDDNAQEE